MVVYSLINDISENKYREFITYCLEHSTFFSLTCYNNEKNKKYLCTQKIQDYFLKEFQTDVWFYNKAYEGTLDIRLYYSDVSLVDFFEKQFGSMFSYQSRGIEDICFFSNDQVMFASITHEELAEIFPSTQIKPSDFQKFSKWKKRVLVSKDYEFLPDFKKFLYSR